MSAVLNAVGSWVLRQRLSRPRLRFFCFPYAGGSGAVFRGWQEALPEVEVCAIQLPGRGRRFREPPMPRMHEIVRGAADALQGLLDLPFAVFGHSMGGLVSFEFVRELRRRGWPAPVRLLVSAHQAAHLPDPDPPMSHLPEAEFLEELRRRYEGVPEEVMAEPELLQLVLPVVRADITVLEAYAYREEPPLGSPLSVFGGEEDRHTSREELEAWRRHTRGGFRLRMFPGNHFFLDSARSSLLQAISEDLALLEEGAGARP